MSKLYLSILLFIYASLSFAQKLEPYSCDVYIDGEQLEMPFVGGLDNPQTYTVDLNNDGLNDLVILDRDGNVIVPFIRTQAGTGFNFKYAPEFKCSFDNVRVWMVMRDYNGDGVMDLFGFPQSNRPGIEVRKGVYVNDTLQFEEVIFNEISGETDILPVPSSNGFYTNLYVAATDQPEIYDVDGDGDMDVLSFEIQGTYLRYYKNYALEKGLGLDTFSMELEDQCWGKFLEKETSQELVLSDDPSNCATLLQDEEVATNRHAGSCVTVFDNNGDGTLDLLLGDLASDQMIMVENEGSNEEAWMTSQDLNFPSYDVPIKMNVFNAGFYLDINNDGNRDLIASPNGVGSSVENHKVMWYYENSATDDNPTFDFQTDLLFVDQMIDFGSGSSPTFVDINQDGLMDVVMGTKGRYQGTAQPDARMLYFKNQGTLETPIFELVDDDFADYAQFQSTAITFNPCFGDLDGDGDIDMVVGDNNGFLFYSENIAGLGQPLEFAPAVYEFQNIQPGNIVRPQIADLNQDGLGDLILGERKNNSDGNGKVGALIFYPNIGTIGAPEFESDEELSPNIIAFGGVNTQTITEIGASTAPYIYHNGMNTMLFTGSKNGKISIYNDIDNNLDGFFNQIVENYGQLNEGQSTTVAVYDIDNDNLLEMLIGNERGGLSFFKTDIIADENVSVEYPSSENKIKVYPNPNQGVVHFNNKQALTYSLHSLDGKSVRKGVLKPNARLDLNSMVSGVYVVQLNGQDVNERHKIVKI